ncbi:hypothetical protein L1887_33419 [Cichorium endivia]|nr:hypothetical protein L1887_33419 [Cichorium endivia]
MHLIDYEMGLHFAIKNLKTVVTISDPIKPDPTRHIVNIKVNHSPTLHVHIMCILSYTFFPIILYIYIHFPHIHCLSITHSHHSFNLILFLKLHGYIPISFSL